MIAAIVDNVAAVLPDYTPFMDSADADASRDDLIRAYFEQGYTNQEICNFLALCHGFFISVRTVKRTLKYLHLRRTTQIDHLPNIIQTVVEEVEEVGSCLGYRSLCKLLKFKYKLKVSRNLVRQILKAVDPDGVTRRKRRKLQRRRYINPGPNYTWHIDGYDKLKPFGFAIHGAIDGYSRRIMWLEVGPSNNDPAIIAKYYLDCVQQLGCVPRVIRADKGTENGIVEILQTYFRFNCDDEFSGPRSFMYGKSTSNQRIEAWWSILRMQCCDWWINFFKDLRDSGIYDDTNPVHCDCLRFCFMKVLRKHLECLAVQWNQHRMLVKRNTESPRGRPDVLYFCPELHGAITHETPVSNEDIIACTEMYAKDPLNTFGCSSEFVQLVNLLFPCMREPRNATDALVLYNDILDAVGQVCT